MHAKPSEMETGGAELKSGTNAGQIKRATPGKASVDYWRTKVRPRTTVQSDAPLLYVRFREAGRDAWICLDTSNKAAAASKAREYWIRMRAIGLSALLAELAPDKKPEKVATVGEAIAEATKLSTVRPVSWTGYVKRLRQIAGEIAGVKRPAKATSWKDEKTMAWKHAVDAISLDVLTADAVNRWKAERISASKMDPVERRSATISADATIRLARAVFGRQVMAAGLGKVLRLPNPPPFCGVAYGKSHRRFVSSVDPSLLFTAARRDLEAKSPQQFLAFSLCLLAGLRRSEADLLTWEQIDLGNGVLRIKTTEYFAPKSEDATREIELDSVAIDVLRAAKADSPDPVFVLKGGAFRRQKNAACWYRADCAPHHTWTKLITWLEAHGIDDPKPIHVLRKMAGSLIFQAHGIEQARGFLGHGDVGTTSRSYLAKTKRVVVSLSDTLQLKESPIGAEEVAK